MSRDDLSYEKTVTIVATGLVTVVIPESVNVTVSTLYIVR